MFRYLLAPAAAAALCFAGPGQAAKVKVWYHHSPAHYDRAHFRHAVLSSEGVLRLSRQLKPLASLDAMHVWDVVEDRAGNLFVATGEEGKIFQVTPAGKVSTAYTSDDSQILCLALAPDGTLYAGTGPGGLILRLTPAGGEVLARTSESYVWSLAVAADGQKLYAGTGPRGRIYELTSRGQARVFYATRQEHVLSLALGRDGLLYAGTDKDGLVYRLDARGKGFVLSSAPQAEVRRLLVTADGAVYAGTSSPGRHRGSSSASGRVAAPPDRSVAAAAPARSSEQTRTSTDSETRMGGAAHRSASEEGSLRAAAAPAPPAAGENSLYRIAPDGTIREIFRQRALLLSLLRQNGHLFVGTGMEGQLFEVEEATKEHSEIARLDHGQIHCLCRRQDGSTVIGTGDPGKLYVLQDSFAPQGTVVSDVLDAKLISKWGALRWTADTPAGTRVSVAVRSGNTPEPSETWSDWSAEQTDPEQAVLAAPAARFLQYRVTLTTEDPQATPAVHSLALRYATRNQAPEITRIQVPDLDAGNFDNPKKLRIKWSATDPNEDELSYSLYVRKEGWNNWVLLEEDLEHTDYDWDTTTAPSGMYRVKVVASDRPDNPPEEALTDERVSAPFAVSHTPPTVTLRKVGLDGDRVILEATATSPLVRLTAASFAVNGKKWLNAFPTDGLFDSKTETFRFQTEPLKPGTYVVVLRVRDAAGNTGSGDVVFTVAAKAARK